MVLTGTEPVAHRPQSKRNPPESRPAANVLKAISNAACKPQAKDNNMTARVNMLRRSEWRSTRRVIEIVQRMQRAHGKFGKGGVNQKRKLDLGRGNGADIDGALGQRAERLRGDAGMAAHADTDDGNLGHVGGAIEPRITDRALRLSNDVKRALIVRRRH